MKGSSSDAASAAAAASPVATSTLRSIVFANCCLLFVVLSNRLRFASAQPQLSTAQQLSLFLFLSLALHLTSLDDAPSLSFSLAHTCSRPVWSAWQRGLSRQIAETRPAASARDLSLAHVQVGIGCGCSSRCHQVSSALSAIFAFGLSERQWAAESERNRGR